MYSFGQVMSSHHSDQMSSGLLLHGALKREVRKYVGMKVGMRVGRYLFGQFKCLTGYKCVGLLLKGVCSKSKITLSLKSVTRSPIGLFWTAKNMFAVDGILPLPQRKLALDSVYEIIIEQTNKFL